MANNWMNRLFPGRDVVQVQPDTTPEQAPYHVAPPVATWGQRHPGLSSVGLGLLNAGATLVNPNTDNIGQVVMSGLGQGIKSYADYNNEATNIRNKYLQSLQEARIKNQQAAENANFANIASPEAGYDRNGTFHGYSVLPTADLQKWTEMRTQGTQQNNGWLNKENPTNIQRNQMLQNTLDSRMKILQNAMNNPNTSDAQRMQILNAMVSLQGANPNSVSTPMTANEAYMAPQKLEELRIKNQYEPDRLSAETGKTIADINKVNADTAETKVNTQLAPLKAQYDNVLKQAQAGNQEAQSILNHNKNQAMQLLNDENSSPELKYQAWNFLNGYNNVKLDKRGRAVDVNPYVKEYREIQSTKDYINSNPEELEKVNRMTPQEKQFYINVTLRNQLRQRAMIEERKQKALSQVKPNNGFFGLFGNTPKSNLMDRNR